MKKTRLTFDCTSQEIDQLNLLSKRIGSRSKVNTFLRAIKLFSFLVDHQVTHGNKIILATKEQSTKEFVILI